MQRGAVLGFFALLLCSSQAGFAQESVGHLVTHVTDASGVCRQTTVPYVPGEGDLVFFNDHSTKWHCLYKLVGSDWPFHASILCKIPDGRVAIAEAGPNDTLHCRVLELSPRLHGFKGTVYIRRCKLELSPERSKAMTDWAVAQDNKRYALGRLLLQATPIRCRGSLRRELFGETYIDRDSYLCAELAIAAGTVGGIFDSRHKANTIYPRDIFYNDIHDLRELYHDVQVWTPTPAGVSPPPHPEKWDRNASLISALPQQK